MSSGSRMRRAARLLPLLAFSFVLIGLCGTDLIAQPGNPDSPVPIDGGLSLLAAGGIALAYRKYRNRQD